MRVLLIDGWLGRVAGSESATTQMAACGSLIRYHSETISGAARTSPQPPAEDSEAVARPMKIRVLQGHSALVGMLLNQNAAT